MAKYIVFEETGEVRVPSRDEFWLQRDGSAIRATYDYEMKLPILRRLTDEEVDALVTANPADDERGRFVRETTVALIGRPVCESDSGVTWYMNEDEAFRQANQLADRFYGVKQP